MRKLVLLILLIPLLLSWKEGSGVSYLTWSAKGEGYPEIELKTVEQPLDGTALPIAGTVSHHLLAGSYMEEWFSSLARRRQVETFLIISPQHWDLGTGYWALTDGQWETAFGPVHSDQVLLNKLRTNLGIDLQRELFHYEHGVSSLIPFIKKYFPHAKVLAIAVPGEPPINTVRLHSLASEILPLLQDDSFLLISSDFSHHGDLAETLRKDTRTRRYLEAPRPANWILAGCDNRPGIFLLSKLMETRSDAELKILYHTNSYEITDQGADDITSYFFTFLTVPQLP